MYESGIQDVDGGGGSGRRKIVMKVSNPLSDFEISHQMLFPMKINEQEATTFQVPSTMSSFPSVKEQSKTQSWLPLQYDLAHYSSEFTDCCSRYDDLARYSLSYTVFERLVAAGVQLQYHFLVQIDWTTSMPVCFSTTTTTVQTN